VYIIIIGSGEVGKRLTNLLSAEKNEVALVESDPQVAKDSADHTDALVIQGDGTDISVLKDAGLQKADVVVAATSDDKTNLMVCHIAKTNNVKRVVARVNQSVNEELFIRLGISHIIPMVGLAVTAMKRALSYDEERILNQIADDVKIVELTVGEKSKAIGKPCDFRLCAVSGIYRDGSFIIPDQSILLKKGDVLVVTLKACNTEPVRKLITGV